MKWTKILAIIGMILLVALVGCKDEAETSEPNYILWERSVYLSVELEDEPNFADGETRIYLYKGDDFDIVIEKPEPNEPTKELREYFEELLGYTNRLANLVEVCFDRLDRLESQGISGKEPNEPEVDYSWLHPIAKSNWILSICSECGKKVHISDVHWCPKQILRYIPTWPDYIELEKELVIDSRGEIRWYNDYHTIPKGTKIYFKEEN